MPYLKALKGKKSEMHILYPSIFILLSVVSMVFLWKYSQPEVRMPAAVYVLSYVVTTVIGATIIGMPGGEFFWQIINLGLDTSIIDDVSSFKYWGLLYAPLVIPMLAAVFWSRDVVPMPSGFIRALSVDVDKVSFYLILVAFAGFCFMKLYKFGYLFNIAKSDIAGDYQSIILLRGQMMSVLGDTFYGILYMALPSFAHLALYQTVKKREWSWLVAFLLTSFLIVIITLSTMQKSILFVYMISIVLGLLVLGVVKSWIVPIAGVAGIIILTVIQLFTLGGEWSVLDSIIHVFFRMANSFPFYVNLFPDIIPFQGIDFFLDMAGIGTSPDDNLVVFDYMFPTVNWTQGSAAAPSHMRAYAQGGILNSLFVLTITGWIMVFLARFRKHLDGPFFYTIFIQGLILLYYMTQTSIRECLVSSYGLRWVIVSLGSAFVLTKAMRSVLQVHGRTD